MECCRRMPFARFGRYGEQLSNRQWEGGRFPTEATLAGIGSTVGKVDGAVYRGACNSHDLC